MLNSLSGRFLFLTAAFVLLAEALILVPSVARSRLDYLDLRLEPAETFLDAFRRLGPEPFKALLYGAEAHAA